MDWVEEIYPYERYEHTLIWLDEIPRGWERVLQHHDAVPHGWEVENIICTLCLSLIFITFFWIMVTGGLYNEKQDYLPVLIDTFLRS